MHLLCALGIHRPPHPYFAARSDDAWLGECSRCLAEIMKKGNGRWKAIPKDRKIVFETRREGGSIRTKATLQPRRTPGR